MMSPNWFCQHIWLLWCYMMKSYDERRRSWYGFFSSESSNLLIFFGSDRSFDVNPVGAESTFYTIRAKEKPHQHFLRFLLSLHSGMFIDDVIKLILPTYLIIMMLYDEIIWWAQKILIGFLFVRFIYSVDIFWLR